MSKKVKIFILAALLLLPLIFYRYLNVEQRGSPPESAAGTRGITQRAQLPKIAIIFDSMGDSLKSLKELYSLKIPLTVVVVPDLKFSKNIAYISKRCGYSVLIQLPVASPKNRSYIIKEKNKTIGPHLSLRKNKRLLRYYLNYIRIAFGATGSLGLNEMIDNALLEAVLDSVSRKDMIFLDYALSFESSACAAAKGSGLTCVHSEGFLDSQDDPGRIKDKLYGFLAKAKEKGKIIILAHPRKNTLKVLSQELPRLRKKAKFLALRDYFGP